MYYKEDPSEQEEAGQKHKGHKTIPAVSMFNETTGRLRRTRQRRNRQNPNEKNPPKNTKLVRLRRQLNKEPESLHNKDNGKSREQGQGLNVLVNGTQVKQNQGNHSGGRQEQTKSKGHTKKG